MSESDNKKGLWSGGTEYKVERQPDKELSGTESQSGDMSEKQRKSEFIIVAVLLSFFALIGVIIAYGVAPRGPVVILVLTLGIFLGSIEGVLIAFSIIGFKRSPRNIPYCLAGAVGFLILLVFLGSILIPGDKSHPKPAVKSVPKHAATPETLPPVLDESAEAGKAGNKGPEEILQKKHNAGPWEYSLISFEIREKFTISCAGGEIDFAAPNGKTKIALVKLAFKALRNFTEKEKEDIASTELGKNILEVSETLEFTDEPFISNHDISLMYIGDADGDEKVIISKCLGINEPRVTFGRNAFFRTVPVGKGREVCALFTFHPEDDLNPILFFTPFLKAEERYAIRISLNDNIEIVKTEHGMLSEMKKYIPDAL